MTKSINVKLIIAMIFTISLTSIVIVKTVEAVPVSDIVFLIDGTSSMGDEIAGVKNGFAGFVNGLNTANVDARYAIIVFGGSAELVLDLTPDATAAQTAFNNITIGANPGFQNNHNGNPHPEAGLEAIRMALSASSVPLVNNNIPEDGILNFRDDARINLILATDEDSDLPFFEVNREVGQDLKFNNTGSRSPTNPLTDPWQNEIDNTVQAVIDNDAFVNMLINIDDAPSASQYGDYNKDVADSDLLNYDPDATLLALKADPLTENSLQAQVLDAGLIGRTFDVDGANNPDFVNNFFASKVQEIVEGSEPVLVPEPSTVMLIGLGLLGMAGAAAMRKWKKTVDKS